MARQHERLVVELLPFQTVEDFHSWLESAPVMGSWLEFRANCRHRDLDEVNKLRIAQLVLGIFESQLSTYLVYHPDKAGWDLENHVARFMVTVIKDAVLQGVWSDAEWANNSLEIAKAVFEVLCFLKAVDEQPSAPGSVEGDREDPPDYSA